MLNAAIRPKCECSAGAGNDSKFNFHFHIDKPEADLWETDV